MTHGIKATCASPNGIETKCASPRWRPSPEIDWHRDRYPRDMINPAGRNHLNRQRSPSLNAIIRRDSIILSVSPPGGRSTQSSFIWLGSALKFKSLFIMAEQKRDVL